MRKYEKANLEIISFVSSSAIANISLDEYLTVNGRDKNDILNLGGTGSNGGTGGNGSFGQAS